MKRSVVFIYGVIIFMMFGSASGVAQENQLPTVLFSGTTYDQLCSYDPLCRNLKHENGSIKQPKRTILVVFQQSAQLVREIAARFNVDPRLLIAVITTEHTLNVQIDDVMQDVLTRTPVAPTGRLGPIHVSYGFGQIYADAADAAEPIAAEIERRAPMHSTEVGDRLKTIEGALTYAAALLVHAQRTYARAGFNISQHPGLLATLYNIGKVEWRIRRTQAENRQPQINYFGWFVEQHWSLFASILEDQLPVGFVTEEDYEAERIRGKLGYADHYPIYFLRNPIPLFFRPDACRDVDSGDATLDSYQRVLAREMVPKADRGRGKFNVLQQALGCQGEVWALARFSSGNIGWLRQSDTQRALEFRYDARSCANRDYDPCLAKIRELLPESEILEFDRTNGILNIKLAGFREAEARDYREYADQCYDPDQRRQRMTQYAENLARAAQRAALQRNNASNDGAYIPQRPRTSLLTDWQLSAERPFTADQHWYRGDEINDVGLEIARVTRELERVTGLRRGIERPPNLVSRLLGFVVSFETYCQSGSCIGPKPELLREYLAMLLPLERLRDPLHYRAVLDRLGNSPSIESASDVNSFLNYERATYLDLQPGPLEFYASRDLALHLHHLANLSLAEQVQLLDQACHSIQELAPEFAIEWQKFRALLSKHVDARYAPDLWFSGSRLGQFLQGCEALSQLVQMTEGAIPRRPIRTSIPCPGRCRLHAATIGRNQIVIDLEILHSFQLSREQAGRVLSLQLQEIEFEFEDNLKTVQDSVAAGASTFLNNGGQASPSSLYYFARGCLYDPEASIARIERLLEFNCVDQVLVPNEIHLVRRFSGPSARGSLAVMPETDRFQITLKPECRAQGRSSGAAEVY